MANWRTRTPQRPVIDTRTGRVGIRLSPCQQMVQLRSIADGVEWRAPASAVRLATPAEIKSALASRPE
ncbi:hypothetical protein DVH02_11710 [Streptomyces corynorhini]|uniref:Uncharacterized protein n=1 Tax=Streptomyces corynorhini TaxID=2282652 RepID=A0A370BBF1_9ACTN|nr:hypothetical protein DVH02_11710 [Streptomyces corynorhini]